MPRAPHRRVAVPLLAAALAGLPFAIAPIAPSSHAEPAAKLAGSAPRLTAESFADPPASVRPKYRWWMPMAFTDDDRLRAELADLKAIGAGGVEVATTTAVGPRAFDPEFLAEYGWGSPRWAEKVETLLDTAAGLDLGLDLTIGPRWPAIVPTVTDVNDPRTSQQLVFSHAFLKGGTTYTGALPTNDRPKPPTGAERSTVAALLARCADPACAGQDGGPRLLDRDSVRDLTGSVGADGTVRVQVPGDAGDTFVLLGFFQTGDGQAKNNFTTTKPNYVLDHLSEQGARATTDFYDASILTPAVREALAKAGRADLFEDSLELGGSPKWTWDFAEQWRQRRGYDPATVLPALTDGGSSGLTAAPYFDFSDGSGPRIRTDYRQTWNDLYVNARLGPLRQWANDRGLALRSQPYGGPIDTPQATTQVDVPEGESLVFGDNIEPYRLVSVGAHLNGSPLVSSECCAARSAVWATTAGGWRETANLRSAYRGYAGGVTQLIWHGYPYLSRGEGTDQQAVWPGMSYGGNTSFAEAWGAKGGPNWPDYRAINDHLGRLQLVLRQGRPSLDVALYLQDLGLRSPASTLTASSDLPGSDSALAACGYTYDYLSPAHLERPDADVSDGRLFADAGGYRAIIIPDGRTLPEPVEGQTTSGSDQATDHRATMPVDTARRLQALADSGLPVIFAGALPTSTPGFHDASAQDAELRRLIAQLIKKPGVHRVADLAAVPDLLIKLGIGPAAAPATPSADVLTVRRTAGSTDYHALFNQRSFATEQRLALTGKGRPYRLDTWTGKITPLTDYRQTPAGVEVDMTLAASDAAVIALSTRQDDTFRWAEADHGPTGAANTGLGPVLLDQWNLQVQSWSRGPSGLPGDTTKIDLPAVQPVPDDHGALPPWSMITPANGYDVDLGDVSGVGTYTSTFTLDDDWRGVRTAALDLGAAVDTVTVTVNGTRPPPQNPQDLRHLEVGRYLRPGQNTLTVRVASTLINAVRVAPGTGAADRPRQDYGLFGPVRLTPLEARQPTLAVEALDRELPLAAGGANQARIKISNPSSEPVPVTIKATAGPAVDAAPAQPTVRIPARSSTTVPIRLTGRSGSGSTDLDVAVAADNGARGQAHVVLRHSDNLAVNPTGSPYPRVWASSSQYQRGPSYLTDGSPTTFWASAGQTPGQAPTPEVPVIIGVDLGLATTVAAVGTSGRANWAPRSYELQTSPDGRRWTTVRSVADGPPSAIMEFTPTEARFVRLRITAAWAPTSPGQNTQLAEFAVYSAARR